MIENADIENEFPEAFPEDEGTLLTIEADAVGVRCDVYLSEKLELTRSAVQKLANDGKILVNGVPEGKNYKLRGGERLEILLPAPEPYEAKPENIPLDVVYEDEHIVVINKPQGMVVHPAPGHPTGTLVNALLYRCGNSLSGVNGVLRPGIVHRIDRDTSGLICVAKNDVAHLSLAEQLKDHTMHREYRAIVVGGFSNDEGTIDAPIGRSPTDRKKMAVVKTPGKTAREAITHYRVLERYRGFSLIEAVLETGRTHQIRAHMAYIGHPLMGDDLYGGGNTAFEKRNAALLHGQCLHAAALILRRPVTGEIMRFTCPPPENFERLLAKLRETVV